MKKLILLLAAVVMAIPAMPQAITFEFQGHEVVDSKGRSLAAHRVGVIEKNITALLNAIDQAAQTGNGISLDGVNITGDAKVDVTSMNKWVRVNLTNKSLVRTAINDVDGFQIRGIGVRLEPVDSTVTVKGEDRDKSLQLAFDYNGTITGVNYELHTLDPIGNFSEVRDQERLNTIKKFVENFRQYYEQKDIKALRQIYSDNALIITGRVIEQLKQQPGTEKRVKEKKVVYKIQKVKEYLDRLETIVFKNTKYINVSFDEIEIERCATPGKTNMYGVSLRQTWDSEYLNNKKYGDEGYLFLLWEFDDTGQNPPKVHIRTWQPLDIKKKDRYTLYDCVF